MVKPRTEKCREIPGLGFFFCNGWAASPLGPGASPGHHICANGVGSALGGRSQPAGVFFRKVRSGRQDGTIRPSIQGLARLAGCWLPQPGCGWFQVGCPCGAWLQPGQTPSGAKPCGPCCFWAPCSMSNGHGAIKAVKGRLMKSWLRRCNQPRGSGPRGGWGVRSCPLESPRMYADPTCAGPLPPLA